MSPDLIQPVPPQLANLQAPELLEGKIEFRTLTEAAPVGIFLTSADGNTIFVNETWCRLAGISAEEAKGTGWRVAIHPDDLERVASEWKRSLTDQEFSVCEFRFLRPDGSVSWILSHAVPQTDPLGNLIGYVGSCVDVTERHQESVLMSAQKDVLEQIANYTPLAEVLTSIAHLVEEQCPGAVAEVLLIDPDGARFRQTPGSRLPSHVSEAVQPQVSIDPGKPFAGTWRPAPPLPPGFGLASCWHMPICSTDGRLTGVLAVYFRDEGRAPSGRETHICQVLAALAELAVLRLKSAQRYNILTEESQRRMRLYEGVLSSTPDLAYVFDLDHRFIFANSALLQMWGKTSEEALGKTCLELGYEPWHAAMHDREIEQVVATKAPIRGDVPFNGTQGRRMYDYIFTPVLGADGEVEAVAGTTRDVTERVQAEQRATFLSDLATRLSVVSDPDEIIRLATSALRERTGAQHCYFVECHVKEDRIIVLKGDARPGVAPIDGEYRLFDFGGIDWWREYSSGNFQIQDVRTHPFTESRQASYRALDIISYAVQPFKSESDATIVLALTDDRPRHWNTDEMGLIEDVVARVWPMVEKARSALDLQESRQQLRLLWESAGVILTEEDPDLMLKRIFDKLRHHLLVDGYLNFMVDDADRSLILKSCYGIPEDRIDDIRRIEFGQAICGVVARDREAVIARSIQSSEDPRACLVRSMGIRAYASYPLVASGELLGTLSFSSTLRDDFTDADLEFMQVISHYVTGAYARLKLVDNLRESDRKKDQFLATLAHELRNPLAPILTGMEVMLARPEDSEKVWEVTGMMQRQVSQMVHLIDDLLDMSRVTTGKIVLKKTKCPLGDIVRSAIEASESLIREYGHDFTVTLPEEPVFLEADPHRIAQVISNLLSNSAKYTPPAGKIELSIQLTGDRFVRISVKDNGYGIAAAEQGRIFKLFEQDDHGRNDGLGIGLTIVKSLVELHGGSVAVRSEGQMKGSEFIVRLPVASSQESPAALAVPSAPSVSKKPHKVLVADDGRSAADVLGMFFQMEGMEVVVAYDGQQAVEAAETFAPDLVFMDLGMPRLDGFEAARIISARFPEARLVALSGWGRDEDRQKSASAGFIEHLIKPVSPQDLRTVLSRLGV